MKQFPSHFLSVKQEPRAQTGKIVVALYDYDARTTEDLTIRTGDELRLTGHVHGDWWMAVSLSTNAEGYIPYNYVADALSIEAQPYDFLFF